MARAQLRSADDAAGLIDDGDVVAITGSGGGLLEADAILAALEHRFLTTGHPAGLTLIHALGIGDREHRGTNRFAHRGMVSRVIGGHWTWSPRMQQLARDEEIEAYTLPSGVISMLLRESGAGRPGLITRLGSGTFVDPDLGGGRMNDRATEDIVRVIEIEGQRHLHYLPLKVDVGIIRAGAADERGNLSFHTEPSALDSMAVAMAARGNGGTVLAQVKSVSAEGDLDPHSVHIPSPMVDAVVVHPGQWQTYAAEFDPRFTSADPIAAAARPSHPASLDIRTIVARRAALEVSPGDVLNLGFGMSAGVADVLQQGGRLGHVDLCIEQGGFGGWPVGGDLFGVSRGPLALLSSTQQFDLIATGLLDITALGMAQVDRHGDVNVTRIAGDTVGPGGFVDISQGARRAVFCGSFTARGLKVHVLDGRLEVTQEGTIHKFVDEVDQISFSAGQALAEGHEALYVTERAVFRLERDGLTLIEVAEGLDPECDVIAHMDFRPKVGDIQPIPKVVFETGRLWERQPADGASAIVAPATEPVPSAHEGT